MAQYNFGMFGNTMGFQMKIMKHLETRNVDRLKDYICAGYDTFNPVNWKDHPCIEFIQQAMDVLKEEGWKLKLQDWGKGKGIQITCVSPDNKWYHSHYDHGKES